MKHEYWTSNRLYAAAMAIILLLAYAGIPRSASAQLPDPNQGPGGPILVIKSSASIFGTYYAEILRTEGFNEFTVTDISAIPDDPAASAAMLAAYDIVILAPTPPLTPAQIMLLTNWVNGGGNLIAMRPDPQLAGLLGLSFTGPTLSDGYLRVNTSGAPGNGIVDQLIQFHGIADGYRLNGASSLATLYSNLTTATSNPALTLINVGMSGGQAAAFAYDLATSIVYSRQGHPAWAAQERDGLTPIRSDDKFYGNATGDPQPDWIDFINIAIPQADEQQRLLANLILEMNFDKKPLPRFWYFPRGEKAVIIMTGDDHAHGGTLGRFDQFKARSPAGCSVANWECVRGTSYIYTNTPITNAQAAAYQAQGFEIGLHINTNCADYTSSSLATFYSQQVSAWRAKYSSVPLYTQRHHCIAWSDWVTGAKIQLSHGMRLDTSYYYWPPGWAQNRPGLFTSSSMPMRFADLNGTLIDVYKATTHMTDESGQQYPFTVDMLLDRALGEKGYYGAFTVNAHTGQVNSPVADAVVTSALARNVPIVSSRQMLEWLDGRNNSSFGSLAWSGSTLSFTITPGAGANGLEALVPLQSAAGQLTGMTHNGSSVTPTVKVIKGLQYASFPANTGAYAVAYGTDGTPPLVIATSPANLATDVNPGATVSATFSEAMDSATINISTFELRDPATRIIPATVSYSALTQTAILKPDDSLDFSTTYTAVIRGGVADPRVKDLAGNALSTDVIWSFTTAAAPPCPCSAWSNSATPANPASSDQNAAELGVKFRVDFDGLITGIRFYKGSSNTGTHVASLWSSSGQVLASATFSNETASGWQQVTFASPVPIQANTVYVASYHAPNGHYAVTTDYFATSGVDNGPVHLLRNGESGGNGVYVYSASSLFPDRTYRASNYWVDVVFTTEAPAPDTTPPTVTATSPADGASGVSPGTAVTATFSEALNPATVNASTFVLTGPSGTLPATVGYNSATQTATLTPTSALAPTTAYTATLGGGTTEPRITDAAGNALSTTFTWTFTTAATSVNTISLWNDATTPTVAAVNDSKAVELGVKFRVDVAGLITGIRFYKGSGNTGTHTASLWSSSGQLLARATFSTETASGWQQVSFASPVPIQANTVYVASYHAPVGRYAQDLDYFATAGQDNAPLHALRNGESGGNGVYLYSAAPAFPNRTHRSTNYWVDVVFTTQTP